MNNMITEKELANRWNIEPSTLRSWRRRKQGPPFVRIESCIRYRIQDVEEYERDNLKR